MTHWMDLPLRSIGRLAWSRSILTPHPRAVQTRNAISFAAFIQSLKDRLSETIARPVPLDTSRPRLTPPKPPRIGSFQPPRYFFKGPIESDRKKNPEPIRYLLTESLELPTARPVPNNSLLLRSLCRGKGRLCQNQEGLIYLDVDNKFISAMMPYLRLQGLIQPPYANYFGPSVGAHIPVIPKREADFHYLSSVKEIGREFSFEIEGLYSLQPDSWPQVEEVWFFKIRSPELEILRQRHQLIARPLGHSFHITVAVQPRNAKDKPRPSPLMRINPAFLAA